MNRKLETVPLSELFGDGDRLPRWVRPVVVVFAIVEISAVIFVLCRAIG